MAMHKIFSNFITVYFLILSFALGSKYVTKDYKFNITLIKKIVNKRKLNFKVILWKQAIQNNYYYMQIIFH